jgi:hypothetical protein
MHQRIHFVKIVLATAVLLVSWDRWSCAQGVVTSDPQAAATGLNLSASPYTGSSLPYGVAFTPQQDLTFNGVSLSLADYSINEYYGNLELSVSVSLFGSGLSESYSPLVLSQSFSGCAAFNFCNPGGPVTLQAGQEYYLELVVSAVGSADPNATENITWVGGGPLTGNAVYDGRYTYAPAPGFTAADPPRYFQSNGDPTAFALEPVPEPSVLSLLGGVGVILGALYRRKCAAR